MRGLIFQEQDPLSNTVSPFWLSYYFEFYLDVDFAPHTLDTDICKMSDWLPHKMCTQHQKYQKGQLIFLVECHKVGSIALGFPEDSADVRIAQYEADARKPRDEILAKMAKILYVPIDVLTVPVLSEPREYDAASFWMHELSAEL